MFAIPIGLFSAIYLAEYAKPSVRSTFKPILEILAGVPTVVYGFFAAITVGPFLKNFPLENLDLILLQKVLLQLAVSWEL